MQRLWMASAIVLGLLVTLLPAQVARTERVQAGRGTLKAVDADRGTVTITSEGKDQELAVLPQTLLRDVAGQPAAGGRPLEALPRLLP